MKEDVELWVVYGTEQMDQKKVGTPRSCTTLGHRRRPYLDKGKVKKRLREGPRGRTFPKGCPPIFGMIRLVERQKSPSRHDESTHVTRTTGQLPGIRLPKGLKD